MNDVDQVAVVTGAGGGMGSAVARAFAREGRALVLADLRAPPLEAIAAGLDVPGAIVAGDITDPAFPQRIVAALAGGASRRWSTPRACRRRWRTVRASTRSTSPPRARSSRRCCRTWRRAARRC